MLEDIFLILKVVGGSRAYKTNTATSDYDYRGIAIPPIDYFLGLRSFEQTGKLDDKEDEVIYDIRKFFKLAMENNPNILEILYTNPEDIIFVNDYGQMILDERDIFLSKRAHNAFKGYALNQYHRMRKHHEWHSNPPDEPDAVSYNGHWDNESGAWKFINSSDKERYKSDRQKYEQYLKWREDRNPERAELEKMHGYDTKHAMHLFRLLQMGTEMLRGNGVNVARPNSEWLLQVRNGRYTYDQMMELMLEWIQDLDESLAYSPLPDHPDFNKANDLCTTILTKLFVKERES